MIEKTVSEKQQKVNPCLTGLRYINLFRRVCRTRQSYTPQSGYRWQGEFSMKWDRFSNNCWFYCPRVSESVGAAGQPCCSVRRDLVDIWIWRIMRRFQIGIDFDLRYRCAPLGLRQSWPQRIKMNVSTTGAFKIEDFLEDLLVYNLIESKLFWTAHSS